MSRWLSSRGRELQKSKAKCEGGWQAKCEGGWQAKCEGGWQIKCEGGFLANKVRRWFFGK